MEEKIYNENDTEYKGDGHLLIDNIDYYSVSTYKGLFNNDQNYESKNDTDSQNLITLSKNRGEKIYHIKPTISNYPYVNCYAKNILELYFK